MLRAEVSHALRTDEFLDSVATGEEIWGFHHTPESKQQSLYSHDDDEMQEVMTWFSGLAANFYDSGTQKLVPKINKCLDNAGDYVEK